MPSVQPKQVRTSEKAKEMLQFDLENEMATIRRYRIASSLGEYAMAEHIREILKDELNHLIDLATVLGEDLPVVKSALSASPHTSARIGRIASRFGMNHHSRL